MIVGDPSDPTKIEAAAARVERIFADGCDRCDSSDLELLEAAGLMERGVCDDIFGQDTLEVGETIWKFNDLGLSLLKRLGVLG